MTGMVLSLARILPKASMPSMPGMEMSRITKSGPRDIAVTDNWLGHRVADGVLVVTVRTVTPTVRPDDIVRALDLADAGAATREAQGPFVDGDVTDPLA